MAIQITPGQDSDNKQFQPLYNSLAPDNAIKAACMDKGYDANSIRDELAKNGIEVVIPPRRIGKRNVDYNKELYKERNRIERFFNKIKGFRRVATRYDKLICTFRAFVQLASAMVCLRNS